MEIGQASELLTLLAAAFPRRWRNAPAEETQLWIELLSSQEYTTAHATVTRIVKTAVEMPSVAEFRAAYFSEAKQSGRVLSLVKTGEEQPDEEMRRTPTEWEKQAKLARTWRAAEFPDTKDPADGTPLPRSRDEFGAEWTAWFREHFGWAPVNAAVGRPTE